MADQLREGGNVEAFRLKLDDAFVAANAEMQNAEPNILLALTGDPTEFPASSLISEFRTYFSAAESVVLSAVRENPASERVALMLVTDCRDLAYVPVLAALHTEPSQRVIAFENTLAQWRIRQERYASMALDLKPLAKIHEELDWLAQCPGVRYPVISKSFERAEQ